MNTVNAFKVLVVEDEPLLLVDIVDIVEDEGYVALEARNADDALRVVESHVDIDVLITDIDMPGSIEGLELAHRVRRMYPDMAIIVISGKLHASKQDMPSGGSFISKPYMHSAIIKALKQA